MKKDLTHNLKIAFFIGLTLLILCTAAKVFMWNNLPLPTATISPKDENVVTTQGYTTTPNLGLRKPNYHQTGWSAHLDWNADKIDSLISGGGGILMVGTDANAQYSTIALAIAAAVSGDMIILSPGTYSETCTVPAGVTLRGVSRER